MRMRMMDPQLLFGQFGILQERFVDSCSFSLLNIKLITPSHVVRLRASASEMSVRLFGDILFADVAHGGMALRADHLVATIFLDNFHLALGTVAYQSLAHSLLDLMSFAKTLILSSFFARPGDVCPFLAQSTTNHLAGRILAAKFSIFLNWSEYCLERTERTVLKPVKTGHPNLVFLLQGVQLGHHRWAQDLF
jgi:hypothetical protein